LTYVHRILQTVEFKDREVTGPMVDQIVGTTLRAGRRFEGEIRDVFIYCRRANSGARARAKEHEKQHKIEIVFVEVKDKA
jgi:hypothetical protein